MRPVMRRALAESGENNDKGLPMKLVNWLIFLAVTSWLSTPNASAAVVLSIGSETVNANGIATVGLDISGLTKGTTALSTYDISVNFNSSVVNFASVSYGDPVLGDQLDLEGFGTFTTTTPGNGTTELFELSLDSQSALTTLQPTSFTLATLTFNALATGTTPLTLFVNALGDQNAPPLSISATLQNGAITVGATPVPLPAAFWLFLSSAGAFAVFAKRRRI
jgi:Cohesin domain